MAKTFTAPITKTIKNYVNQIVNATGASSTNEGKAPTNTVSIFSAGSDDSILKSLRAFSDDSVTLTLMIYLSLNAGTDKYPIAKVSIAAGTQVDILANIAGLTKDQSNKYVLPLASGSIIYASVLTTTVSANKILTITADVEDF